MKPRSRTTAKRSPTQEAAQTQTNGPWLRIGPDPNSLLIVADRTASDEYRYVGSEADLMALDDATLRAVSTELAGPDRRFATRTAAVAEVWAIVENGFAKARGESPDGSTPATGRVITPGAAVAVETSREQLSKEIEALRVTLREKLAALRALGGSSKSDGSDTVARVVAMLCGSGATKEQIVAATGAKKGYVDALLGRILPARGHVISSSRSEASREKIYRLSAEGPPAADRPAT